MPIGVQRPKAFNLYDSNKGSGNSSRNSSHNKSETLSPKAVSSDILASTVSRNSHLGRAGAGGGGEAAETKCWVAAKELKAKLP